MEENLLTAMQIIDRNSDKLSEGDYLQLANILKEAYNKRVDPVYFFDYEQFNFPHIGESEYVTEYFKDYYFDKCLNLDSDFLQGQLTYLRRELEFYQPIQRASKNIKESVKQHYLMMFGQDVNDLDEVIHKKALKNLCSKYIFIENQIRQKYREAIEKKIEWLEDADDKLDTF